MQRGHKVIAGTKKVICFAVRIAIFLIAPLCSQAAVFVIPDGDIATLISAINVANTNGEDDTIELAADGTYTVVEPTDSCFRTGLPAILSDGGRTLTIQGNGAHILRDDGNPNQFPIFAAGVNACVNLTNLTISHGSAVDTTTCAVAHGGAAYVYYAAVTITNCIFNDNNAHEGGAIFNLGGSLTISDSSFTRNTASPGSGGAIENDRAGTMTIIHCTFSENAASFGGGAIFNAGGSTAQQNVAMVESSSFTGNAVSWYGGAVWNWNHASCRVIHSTFDGNSAARSGGAFYNNGSHLADLTIDSCTITGNSAGPDGGGAICNFAGNDGTADVNTKLTVINSTLSGNSASVHGGGIYNDRGNVGLNTGSVTVCNSVFKSGELGENLYNAAGTINSQGHNLSDDNGGGFLTAIGDEINTEPMLDPSGLQNNGGPTRTIALSPQSPGINSGDPNAPVRDQRYYLRSDPPDKGAFEYGGTIAPLSVVSRKVHGNAGTFDVDLPLNNIGVECRASGGHHQLIATFATPVTIGNASVTTGNGSVENAAVNGAQLTMDLTGVSDAQQIVVTVSDVSDGANTNLVSIPMRVLLGDTNGNNVVNASDVSQTKSEVGQLLTSSNFRTDVNVNGTTNATDVAQVKAHAGTAIPIPLAR